jgi:hypothetical protein
VSVRVALEELLHEVALAFADSIPVVVATLRVALRTSFCRVEKATELLPARRGEVRGKLARRGFCWRRLRGRWSGGRSRG